MKKLCYSGLAVSLAATLSVGPLGALPAQASHADLSITDVTGVEGDTLVFQLSRAAGGIGAKTFTYSVLPGTATEGEDYTATSGSVTFPDNTGGTNVQVQMISVPTLQDALDEVDENFTLQFVSTADAHVVSGRGTIRDDDASPTFSLSGPADAVDEGAGTATVTATLSAVSGRTSTIDVASADGTATAGQDYTAIPGGAVISIPAGTLSGSVTVPLTDDALDEASPQTFEVNGSAGAGVTAGTPTSVTVGIADNDATPTLSVGGAGAALEGGSLTFPVSLSAASEQTVTVVVNTSGGTATPTDDYTAVNGQVLTFAPGVTSSTVVVPTALDALDEVDETVTVSLDAPVNAVLDAGTAGASGTITDDDAAPTVSLAPVMVTEGSTGATDHTFTATLSAVSGQPVTVGYSTGGGTATDGTDYTGATGTLTFAPGTTTQTFSVSVNGDTMDEPNETFDLTLTNSDGTVGTGGALGANSITITDDDNAPTFQVNDISYAEGDVGPTSAIVYVELSNASAQPVAFDVSVADGTAVEGGLTAGENDYDSAAGTVTVPAGETQAGVTILITGDTVFERNETFDVTAALAAGETDATGGPDTGTVTITNDDAEPVVAFNNESGVEGTTASVKATVTGIAQDLTTLNVTVAGAAVRGSDPAEAGDFENPGVVTLNIPGGTASGSTLAVTTFRLSNDLADENPETVVVDASVAAGFAAVLPGVQTINDDPGDVTPTVDLGDVTVTENAGTASVPVTLTPTVGITTERTITVDYATAPGSADVGLDFTPTTGSVVFAPGVTSRAILVPIVDDSLDEPLNQQFIVWVSGVTPADTPVGNGAATVTITDDDATAAATITAPAGRRGTGDVQISGFAREDATVTLYEDPYGPVGPSAVASMRAGSDGGYSFTRRIARENRYWVRAANLNSEPVTVKVFEAPTLAVGSTSKGRASFRVRSNPALASETVSIFRMNADGTRGPLVARGLTTSVGGYFVTVGGFRSGASYTFRAYVAADFLNTGVRSGWSPRKSVKVQ